jgi:muconolactone delta-isomerase
MQGPSIEWIEAALASLPLHPYMDVELTALLD